LGGKNLKGNYVIYDSSQKILKSGTIHSSDEAIIDVSGLSSGVYFLQFFAADGIYIRKILKE
jgi:hypothetical protein